MLFPESSCGVTLLRFAGSSRAFVWLTLGGPVCAHFWYIQGGMTREERAMKTPEKSRGELALDGAEAGNSMCATSRKWSYLRLRLELEDP